MLFKCVHYKEYCVDLCTSPQQYWTNLAKYCWSLGILHCDVVCTYVRLFDGHCMVLRVYVWKHL